MSRRFQVGFVSILVLAVCVLAGEAAVVETLDGEPVNTDEFAFYAAQVRVDPVKGVVPRDLLRREALRAIARTRILQQMALDAGLIGGARTYRQLVVEFHAGNERRKEMKERGEVFYGPVRFRQDVWFKVHFEKLSRMLVREAESSIKGDFPREEREREARKVVDLKIEKALAEIFTTHPSTSNAQFTKP